MQEAHNEVVTLKDDSAFADALDCMVSYFYEADYDAYSYETTEPLLHAQVAIPADKYDCESLHKLACTFFVKSAKTLGCDDWAVIAALVYDHTTTESPVHVGLRDLVVAAVAGRPSILKSMFQDESIEGLLRSNADLATDLLLGGRQGLKAQDVSEYMFKCDQCRYAHAGSRHCPNVAALKTRENCPQCQHEPGTVAKRYLQKIDLLHAFLCPACDGIHTIAPVALEHETLPEP